MFSSGSSSASYLNINIINYKFAVILYGCSHNSGITRTEMFENTERNRILRSERQEATRGWKKNRNEKIHDVYSSSVLFGWSIQGLDRWASTGEKRNECKIFVGKPEWKRQLRRFKLGWERDIQKDSKETDWEDVTWSHLDQHRVLWARWLCGIRQDGEILGSLSAYSLLKDSIPWS
jgi:hypothetical protein